MRATAGSIGAEEGDARGGARGRVGARLLAALAGGLLLTAAGSAATGSPAAKADAAPEPVRYDRDVRPILSNRCFQCHGPDASAREADLRLDSFDEATKLHDGSAAVVPGDPDASEMIERVCSDSPKHYMPPPKSGKPRLTVEEQDVLRRWIAAGAKYEGHWAFEPPVRPATPEVQDPAWVRDPIDAFVLKRLEGVGATPSPEADPHTLLRRLFFEVTGLPPTPDEIDAFLADVDAQGLDPALDRWVDRLLTEEPYRTRYAEHMARPWLDQARYADTSGIHMDAGRQAWEYRDWVIQAFHENEPFDRFVVDQLAGDLIPDGTTAQKVASGFQRMHVTTDEGGAIDAEYKVVYVVDRVKTLGAVLLGLTVGCAQCHDHKFDPITMEDFYGLYAFFDSIEEPGLYSQSRNDKRALEPFMDVPTAEQQAQLDGFATQIAGLKAERDDWTPEEEADWEAYRASLKDRVHWAPSQVVGAEAGEGVTLTPQDDGSVLAGGASPANDVYTITLRTDGTDLRALLLEALPADGLEGTGPIGRAPNGNAVIRSVTVEAVSVADPSQSVQVPLVWATADYAQADLDFEVTNVLDPANPRWWALGGHEKKGARAALLLAGQPFGFEGGTEVRVRIDSTSIWAQHTLARPRLSVGSIDEAVLGMLPTTFGRFYQAGPFRYGEVAEGYDHVYPPETVAEIEPDVDLAREPGDEKGATWRWRFDASFQDGRPFNVATDGRDTNYLARDYFAPTARDLDVSLGSDDGVVLLVDGQKAFENRVDRSVAPDQDATKIHLAAGRGLVTEKVVNTGGPSAAYFRATDGPDVLAPDLVPLLYPERARTAGADQAAKLAWRRARSPRFVQIEQQIADLDAQRTQLLAAVPRAMVMKELPKPVPTYVLNRGRYDHPEKDRPVERAIPKVLGKLPDDAPRNRLGLAQWIVSDANPLTARVTVNRFWAEIFGAGLVATTDDFGYQGEWPSDPALLDWLAVEFRESGWDVQHLLRLILDSATWRQASDLRPAVAGLDPEDRLLSRYPRKRLAAEAIRDAALYESGLLVERTGGPSVKPYQPEGLWKEVAMIQSNTRIFQRGEGEDLWRRSLYTYWKRAAPPPSMLAFDAPTREFCVVQRATTDTPLQALVLMNDEQFLEAARVLAQRTLSELPDGAPGATNAERVDHLFLRVLGREPEPAERDQVLDTLAELRWRYETRPEEARELLEQGEAPVLAEVPPPVLASWTLAASALMNLFESTNPR